jgi:hypothetical protein
VKAGEDLVYCVDHLLELQPFLKKISNKLLLKKVAELVEKVGLLTVSGRDRDFSGVWSMLNATDNCVCEKELSKLGITSSEGLELCDEEDWYCLTKKLKVVPCKRIRKMLNL